MPLQQASTLASQVLVTISPWVSWQCLLSVLALALLTVNHSQMHNSITQWNNCLCLFSYSENVHLMEGFRSKRAFFAI